MTVVGGKNDYDQINPKYDKSSIKDGLTEVIGQFGLFHLVAYLALWASVIPHAEQVCIYINYVG